MGVIARQSIKGAIANYIGVAIGFYVSFFILTRYLTQEEIGLTRVMVDAAVLFSSLASLGSNASIVRFFPWFRDGGRHHGIFGWSLLLPLAGFSLFALIFLIFKAPLLEAYSVNAPLLADYFHLVPMLTFFALYVTVFETNASVLMRITVPKLVREVGIRLFNLAAYLLYGYRLISLDLFVCLFCGSYALAMLLNLFYLLKINRFDFSIFRIDRRFLTRDRVREVLRYTLFMTAAVLAGNIPLFNSLFLGAKAGLALTGVYTIASYVANVVEVPYRSLGAISRPVIAAAVKEERWDEVSRLARQVSLHQLLVSLLIFTLIWINIDALFTVIPNGADYAAGGVVVFVLGLAKVVNSSLSIATDVLNYSRLYSRSLLFIALLTAAAIGFNQLLIPRMGIGGAAAATLCAYGLYFALLLAYLHLRLRVSIFSAAQLKVLTLIALMLLLGEAWSRWLTPLLGLHVLLDAALKTLLLAALALWGVYSWRISQSVNDLLKKFVRAQ